MGTEIYKNAPVFSALCGYFKTMKEQNNIKKSTFVLFRELLNKKFETMKNVRVDPTCSNCNIKRKIMPERTIKCIN